jgi:hypothetical protein
MFIWENMEGEKTLVVKLNAKICMSCEPILEFDFHKWNCAKAPLILHITKQQKKSYSTNLMYSIAYT